MKKNSNVTNRNFEYPESSRIVSTTTSKGVLTHTNNDFEKISGFTHDELIGQAHNIVRHPDMPQAAFKDLWDTVKDKKPWMGIVKNRCKNGDHYWVDAFVMPYKGQDGEEDGLQSVRFKPSPELVDRAEAVYSNLNKQKSPFTAWHPKHWSLFSKISSVISISMLPLIFCLSFGMLTIQALSIGLSVGLALGLFFAGLIANPYKAAANHARTLYENPLTQYIYTGRQDELGALKLGQKFLKNKLETALWRVTDSAESVEKEALHSTKLSKDTSQASDQQTQELEQLATAMNEMVSTISDVSRSAVEANDEMEKVKSMVNDGSTEVGKTKDCIDSLVKGLSSTALKVQEISKTSHTISDLVNAIHSIAEQTNLLALNAAIEAARAGEQGRGFAVVADEVRNLANNTATTTEHIQKAIGQIRGDVDEAVTLMNKAEQESRQTIEQSSNAHEVLQSIRHATDETLGVVIQIATATEEQHAVSEEINRNVHQIQDSSNSSARNMSDAQIAYTRLQNEVKRLRNVANDFTSV